MTRTELDLGPLARAVEASDYVRYVDWDRRAPPQREWFHFIVHAPDVDLIANFSVVEPPRVGDPALGNVLLLARVRDGARHHWEGDLDGYELQPGDIGSGRVRLRVGDCSFGYADGYRLEAHCRRRALRVALRLAPTSAPGVVQTFALRGGGVVHWVVVPRLAVSGTIWCGERAYEFTDAVGYHDHNWGRFVDSDLCWEWGCALADDARSGDGVSLVFVRVNDRARDAALAQGLLLWEGASRRPELRGAEVAFSRQGWLRPTRAPSVPRGLSLLTSLGATDVPERLLVRAHRDGDRLDCAFDFEDAVRVLAPRRDALATAVVHEAVGRLHARGSFRGRTIALDAPAFCEFMGAP